MALHGKVFKLTFAKPIDQELVFEVDLLKADGKNETDLGLLYLLTKEGWQKELLVDFHQQRQALSRFYVGAVVTSESVIDVIRRELRRICPDVKIRNEQIEEVLLHEVLKREVVEGDKAGEAKRRLSRTQSGSLKPARPKN